MIASRKEKLSYLPKNLLYLREQAGKTLEEMARFLSLSGKSSYKAYESGIALPNIHKLMKLASFFDVPVADLLYKDIENSRRRVTIEPRRLFEIPKVPLAASAGYAMGFGDDTYIKKLKTIKIPYEPYGIARAFDIDGDSMEPEIKNGATVVGIKVRSATEIKDNKQYVVVSEDGVQCKNIRVEKGSEFIYLISKNEKYLPKHMRKDAVLEVWEVWKII